MSPQTRIVRVNLDGSPQWGLVEDEQVYTLKNVLDGDWQRGSAIGPLESLQLLAPTVPTKIVCVGRNYPAHAAEHQAEVPKEPLIFFKPPSSVIGPDAPIVPTTSSCPAWPIRSTV